MTKPRRLDSGQKEELSQLLGDLFSRRPEIAFTCVHGNFLDPDLGSRDIDIAMSVDTLGVTKEAALDYQWELSAWTEKSVPHPVDARVLNCVSPGFRYSASEVRLLWTKDPALWYHFREETCELYLNCVPLARRSLLELLETQVR